MYLASGKREIPLLHDGGGKVRKYVRDDLYHHAILLDHHDVREGSPTRRGVGESDDVACRTSGKIREYFLGTSESFVMSGSTCKARCGF